MSAAQIELVYKCARDLIYIYNYLSSSFSSSLCVVVTIMFVVIYLFSQ